MGTKLRRTGLGNFRIFTLYNRIFTLRPTQPPVQ